MLIDKLFSVHSFHSLSNITSINNTKNKSLDIPMPDFVQKSAQFQLPQLTPSDLNPKYQVVIPVACGRTIGGNRNRRGHLP
jgi:hypothetical protein